MAQVGVTGRRCAVYDAHTYEAKNLRRPAADQEIILDPDGLHANEVSTARVLALLEEGTEVLIAVGGGTVHDIVRFCARERGLPFVSVPTAASCDGFCSNVAAMTWYGYKKTMACAAPALVAADLDIISEAPWFLTLSGVGDMLGKFVALADWRMAHAVTGEEVCPVIYGVMHEALEQVWTNCAALREGKREAYEAVAYGLLMSGLAMQMLGTSRPASGGEHHISHFIETEPAILNARSDALHGEKVGVGTVIASREYHRLAEIEDISDRVIPFAPIPEETLLEVFGPKLFEAVRDENRQDCLAGVTPEALQNAWPELRTIIADIPPAEELLRTLELLGARRTLPDVGVPEDRLEVLLRWSPIIRNRLTLMRMRRMLRI